MSPEPSYHPPGAVSGHIVSLTKHSSGSGATRSSNRGTRSSPNVAQDNVHDGTPPFEMEMEEDELIDDSHDDKSGRMTKQSSSLPSSFNNPRSHTHTHTGPGVAAYSQGDLSALSLLASSELVELERAEAARRAEYESKHRDLLAAVASVGGHMPPRPSQQQLQQQQQQQQQHHHHQLHHSGSTLSSGSITPERCKVTSSGLVSPGLPPGCHHEECHKSYRSALKASSRLVAAAATPSSSSSSSSLRNIGAGLSRSLEEGTGSAFMTRSPLDRPRSNEGRCGAPQQPQHPPSPNSTTDSDLSSPQSLLLHVNARHTQGGQQGQTTWHSSSSSSLHAHSKSMSVLPPTIPKTTTTTSQPSTPFWTPSTSPVLGPLRGLNIIDWSSRAGSRAGSPGPFLLPVAIGAAATASSTGRTYGEVPRTMSGESVVRPEMNVKVEDTEMDVDDGDKRVHQEAPRRGCRVGDILNSHSSPTLPMYGDRTLAPPLPSSAPAHVGLLTPVSSSGGCSGSISHHSHGYHPYPPSQHHQHRSRSGYVTAPVSALTSPTNSRPTSPNGERGAHHHVYRHRHPQLHGGSRRSAPSSPRLGPTTGRHSPPTSKCPPIPQQSSSHSHLAHSVRVAFGMTPIHPPWTHNGGSSDIAPLMNQPHSHKNVHESMSAPASRVASDSPPLPQARTHSDGSVSVHDEELQLPPLRLPLGLNGDGSSSRSVGPAPGERIPGSRLDLAGMA